MSEKTTTHVDTPLGPSTQRALDAVRDLHAAGQIATREAVSELTGDRLSVVDDFLMTDRALLTLWPALPPAQRLVMAESLVREFM